MKRIVVFSLAVILATAVLADGPSAITTVILVRHAEKVADPSMKDPPLTDEGRARAEELKQLLRDAGVSAIFTTPWERTRQTAAPLAAALGLAPAEIRTGPAYAGEVASTIRDKHAGSTVLVVGHSNTTTDVLRALGVADAPKIEDAEYDNLFVVTLVAGSEPSLLKLKFGRR
jgi:broad specificity phosphatase PhoE